MRTGCPRRAAATARGRPSTVVAAAGPEHLPGQVLEVGHAVDELRRPGPRPRRVERWPRAPRRSARSRRSAPGSFGLVAPGTPGPRRVGRHLRSHDVARVDQGLHDQVDCLLAAVVTMSSRSGSIPSSRIRLAVRFLVRLDQSASARRLGRTPGRYRSSARRTTRAGRSRCRASTARRSPRPRGDRRRASRTTASPACAPRTGPRSARGRARSSRAGGRSVRWLDRRRWLGSSATGQFGSTLSVGAAHRVAIEGHRQSSDGDTGAVVGSFPAPFAL